MLCLLLQTEVGMVGEGVVSVTDEWKEKLIDNLLNFAGTPKVSYLTRKWQ